MPYSSGNVRAAGNPLSHLGRAPPPRRPETVWTQGRRSAPSTAVARVAVSCPRDVSRRAPAALASGRAVRSCLAPRTRAGVAKRVPDSPVLDPDQPPAPDGGSGRPERALARSRGPRDTPCQGGESRAGATGQSVGRPLPRTSPHDSARGSEWSRVCSSKLAQASPGCGRSRSVLFGGMVHRLADSGRRGVRTSAGVPAAHLAGGSGMAAARTHRS